MCTADDTGGTAPGGSPGAGCCTGSRTGFRSLDPQELQTQADQILVEAAAGGAGLDDLKLLAQAAYEAWRAREPDPDDDPRGTRIPGPWAPQPATATG
jgi:hypothetical protein